MADDNSSIHDLDSLLAGGDGAFSTINPEIVEAGDTIARTLLEAGLGAWGVLLGRGVLYSEGETDYVAPADALAPESGSVVITTIQWSGDREGEVHLVLPELGAKGVVAYMMALMMGSDADPETTALDAEGMDAYTEALNNLLGQGAQALRGEVGGEISLTASSTRVVDFGESPPAMELGTEEFLCHTAQMTIEGMVPIPMYVLMSIGVTGMSLEIPASEEDGDDEAFEEEDAIRNEKIALKLRLPVVVLLAEKTERIENIRTYTPGSIIQFRKQSGELLDVCAGDIKFAEGEVVITNEHFGIQLQKLVDVRAALKKSMS